MCCLKRKHLTPGDLEERSQVGLGVWLSRQGLGRWPVVGVRERGGTVEPCLETPERGLGIIILGSDEESLKMFR